MNNNRISMLTHAFILNIFFTSWVAGEDIKSGIENEDFSFVTTPVLTSCDVWGGGFLSYSPGQLNVFQTFMQVSGYDSADMHSGIDVQPCGNSVHGSCDIPVPNKWDDICVRVVYPSDPSQNTAHCEAQLMPILGREDQGYINIHVTSGSINGANLKYSHVTPDLQPNEPVSYTGESVGYITHDWIQDGIMWLNYSVYYHDKKNAIWILWW